MRLTTPYRSADGETLYANTEGGTRRRVRYEGRKLVTVRRIGKAAKKAAKRARRRS